MKTRILILAVILVFLLNGCIVKSLHQFYDEKEVIFEDALVGTWLDDEKARWEISPFTFSKGFMKGDSTDNSYLVVLYEDSINPIKFNAHLFQVGDKKYLDFAPLREDRYEGLLDMHLVSVHSLAFIDFTENDKLTISWFNEEWLGKLFEENRVKIAHEVVKGTDREYETEYILTASITELQKFVLKYANPEDAGHTEHNDDNFMRAQLTRID
jgi:uncharacterized protein YcfL